MNNNNPNNDIVIDSSPSETVSCMRFNPKQQNMLLASSWDKTVSCWEVQQNGMAVPKAQQKMEGPILACDWAQDGQTAFMAGCDNKVKAWSLSSNQTMDLGMHQAPVKTLFAVQEMNAVCTGSWDKTIKFWDARSPKQIGSIDLDERVYSMDAGHPLLVVGMAERKVSIFDLRKLPQPFRNLESPLRMQTRCVAAFTSKDGFAIGSIEGRVGIHCFEDKSRCFAFKCHRGVDGSKQGKPDRSKEIYSVNCIAFHKFNTFATAGSDGVYTFWDKDAKRKLKSFEASGNAITAATFNHQGNIFAYAVGYDWSKGIEYADKQTYSKIHLHAVKDDEISKYTGDR